MYSMTKTNQESILPHTGGWSLNETIMGTGQATADNLPTRIAQIQYAWRTPDISTADKILQVLDRNAKHAAAISHCKVVKRWVARSRPGLANHALAELVYRNLELAGAPQYSEAAVKLARDIQRNLGLEPMDQPFLEACEKLISPQDAEQELRRDIPAWQKNWTSDDYVEMSWHTPTVRLYVARPMLKVPRQYAGYPDWVSNALGGMRDCIDPTVIAAAKTIAATIVEFLTDDDARKKIRHEFNKRTGGGIGGDKWIPPLLPKNFEAPIDYPWPEYITTVRGEDWLTPNCEDY
jgi:aminobenzoyl-glutamate utilization protein B